MILSAEILTLYRQLSDLGEISHIEAKKVSQIVGDSVMQTICAFANTAGGYLLLGVSEPDEQHDDFWVSGVNNQDDILNQIQVNCRSQFNQVIAIDMGLATINNKTIVAIKVDELPISNKPCGFIAKGKNGKNFTKTGVWLRGINNDYEATINELKPLMLAQAGIAYEQVVLEGVTLNDIETKHLERYRKLRATVKPNATELEYDDTELLLALDVATEKNGKIFPNVAGLLLFGTDKALRRLMPMVRVDYIRHAGTIWVEDADQRFLYTNDLREAIITMIPKLEASVIDDLPKHFNLPPNSLQRADTPILPQNVVREAIVNMLMHRDYSVNQPSQINRFSDRIEFTNAGYSLKPVEKINGGEKGSELRNPIIAQVLYDLTFAETKGSGITTMNRGLKKAGLSPVIFKSKREYNQSETVLRLQKLIAEDEMTWLQQFEGVKDKEAEVLILAKKMGQITNKDIRENIGLDTLQASSILKKFCKNRYLDKHGKGNNSYYLLNSSLAGDNQLQAIDLFTDLDNRDNLSISNTNENEPRLANDNEMTAIKTLNDGGNKENDGGNKENDGGNKENDGGKSLNKLQKLAREINETERTKVEVTYKVLLQLCALEPLSILRLSEITGRKSRTLREHLSKLVDNGYLTYIYPNNPKHKKQAYQTTEKGKALFDQLNQPK